MKKVLVMTSFVILTGLSKAQSGFIGLSANIPETDTVSFVGKTNVFMGDSFTFGFGLSDTTKRYSNIFSKYRGANESNLAGNGKYLQFSSICTGAYVKFDKTTIPTYIAGTHACLFIALGVNDIALNTVYGRIPTTPAKYSLTLDSAVDYAMNTKGWPHRRIIIVTPFWIFDYSVFSSLSALGCGHVNADATLQEEYVAQAVLVASLRKCTIADIYTAEKNSPLNSTFQQADLFHPNNTGNIFISTFLSTITYLQ